MKGREHALALGFGDSRTRIRYAQGGNAVLRPHLDAHRRPAVAARILEQEHKIYPRAVQLFAEGRLKVDGRRVLIEDGKAVGDAIISPS